jgi:hypothetical protein
MLGYDIITISDYMKINTYGKEKPGYVPVYEHGYGIRKFHQVCIGTERVQWRDYPFFQTLHHKQHILNILRKHNELVYVAHPRLRLGYHPDDFIHLTGYDGVEVLNYMRFSIDHWDAALSAGRYVQIIGNDDAHDIDITMEIGYRCTYVYTPHLQTDSIIKAMKEGKAFGADIYRDLHESYEEKAEKAKHIAKLSGAELHDDTLCVSVSKEAMEFRFIGQLGKILKTSTNTDTACYVIQPEDTYVRTEITFHDKNVFYLNPVVRYEDELPANPDLATVNRLKSWTYWIISWGIVAGLVYFIIRRRFRRRKVMRYSS